MASQGFDTLSAAIHAARVGDRARVDQLTAQMDARNPAMARAARNCRAAA
jgi:hypothetical protein